ncbi:MAG: MiaB/RimO family radical SAM methylthiotransferase [Planctomycetaceae bacterium]|nr:MiaB/RimO family radical SAM methylthiotransferase [Planctomycetaceae bacterium]
MLLKTATLGCKVNQYETQFVREALERIGYRVAAQSREQLVAGRSEAASFCCDLQQESADLVIVNTCTVTAESDLKSRKLIRRMAKLNPQAQIVVMGCYATRCATSATDATSATTNADEIRQMPQVVEVITDKRDIPAFLKRRGVIDVPTGIASFGGSSLAATGSLLRHRAYVKVQDGCRVGCSYCIIPKVRPYLLSRPVGEVLDEIRRLVDSGYREIVLVGIHLGHYGLNELQVAAKGSSFAAPRNPLLPCDRDEERVAMLPFDTQTEQKPLIAGNVRKGSSGAATCNLSQLVERIVQLDGEFRLRVSSMEAIEVSDALIDLMRDFPKKLCPHLHLSMQSGSDEVLRNMRRRWLSGPFFDRCEQIKAAIDRVALTTDVIVGFPGETEAQFVETCDMVERIGFSKVHVFPFSPREGTDAAAMPNQIAASEKERRVTHLMQLAERLRENFAASQIGQTVQVLFETRRSVSGRFCLDSASVPGRFCLDSASVPGRFCLDSASVPGRFYSDSASVSGRFCLDSASVPGRFCSDSADAMLVGTSDRYLRTQVPCSTVADCGVLTDVIVTASVGEELIGVLPSVMPDG